MANPFTYLELRSTDATRAKSFYAELFGWKTKDTPVPGLGTYTEIDTQEGPGAGLTAQREPGARSDWLAYIRLPRIDETVAPRTDIKEGRSPSFRIRPARGSDLREGRI